MGKKLYALHIEDYLTFWPEILLNETNLLSFQIQETK